MRKLMRSVARHEMLRLGYRHLNQKPKGGASFFALNWRDFVAFKKKQPTRRRQRRNGVFENAV